jgi:hypothetical protein
MDVRRDQKELGVCRFSGAVPQGDPNNGDLDPSETSSLPSSRNDGFAPIRCRSALEGSDFLLPAGFLSAEPALGREGHMTEHMRSGSGTALLRGMICERTLRNHGSLTFDHRSY